MGVLSCVGVRGVKWVGGVLVCIGESGDGNCCGFGVRRSSGMRSFGWVRSSEEEDVSDSEEEEPNNMHSISLSVSRGPNNKRSEEVKDESIVEKVPRKLREVESLKSWCRLFGKLKSGR